MTLTEVYQTGEDKYHTILLTREIQNTNKQTWENRKRGTGSENKQVTAGLGERLRGTTYIENKQALRLQCATRGTEAILYKWSTTLQKSDSFSCTPETYILLCINSISQKRKKKKHTKFQLQSKWVTGMKQCGEESQKCGIFEWWQMVTRLIAGIPL